MRPNTRARADVQDDLVDDAPTDSDGKHDPEKMVDVIEEHLRVAFQAKSLAAASSTTPDDCLADLPMTADREAFYIFATLIPPLCPVDPFLELCQGYRTDLLFSRTPIRSRLSDPDFALETHLPIRTHADLMQYADNVAGSIASAIVYLSASVLQLSHARPVEQLEPLACHVHPKRDPDYWTSTSPGRRLEDDDARVQLVLAARKMGRALQVVNIARDVAKDAAIGRLYIPLSAFTSPNDILDILLYSPSSSPISGTNTDTDAEATAAAHVGKVYARYNLPLLDLADELRSESEEAIARLPRTARGGMRAMVASYFEIAVAVRREEGRVDEKGVRVSKAKRAYEAAVGLWLGEGLLCTAF